MGLVQWIRYTIHANTEGKLMARLTKLHHQQFPYDVKLRADEDKKKPLSFSAAASATFGTSGVPSGRTSTHHDTV
jgi:hypothetical protein